LALWPWAPDEPEDIRLVLTLGVQGIMTNRPDMLNKVLQGVA
jgi:glycerophosphoryl diester phosphodiesterase